MKKKTAPRKRERLLFSQKQSTPQSHTHIRIHSTSSSSPSPPSKQTDTMRRKVIATKTSTRKKKEKAPVEEEEESHTSPIPSPPPSPPKRSTPHASGKSSHKAKGFVLHETREPTNLGSMEFKTKFHKPHSHLDPSRFSTCASYEFHKEVLEKRHLCPSYLVNLESLASKGINLQPLFDGLKWSPLLLIHKMVYPGLVRQFYANLRFIDGSLHSYVKRVHITLNSESIASALGYIDEGPKVYMSDKWDSHVGVTYKQVLHQTCENLSGLDGTVPTHKALGPTNSLMHRIITHILTPQSCSHNRHFKVYLTNEDVENKVSMIKGGGVFKREKKSMASDDDFESWPESSKTIGSLREILTEFTSMSELMVQFHKSARKLAYENESAWKKCQERVGLMLESLNDDGGNEAETEDSDFNFSDD